MLDMKKEINIHEQRLDIHESPQDKMADFTAYADEVEAGLHDEKIVITDDDKGDHPVTYSHPRGYEAGESAAKAYMASPDTLKAREQRSENQETTFRRRRLGVLATPLVAGLLYAAMTQTPSDIDIERGSSDEQAETTRQENN